MPVLVLNRSQAEMLKSIIQVGSEVDGSEDGDDAIVQVADYVLDQLTQQLAGGSDAPAVPAAARG